jgi:hypothetical protein
MSDWEAAAKRLAHKHYAIDPAITEIRMLTPGDAHPAGGAIQLLEVNADTIEAGILPLRFDPVPASGIPFPSVIVEVTPEEYRKIQSGSMSLPYGWNLGPVIPRPKRGRQQG